MDNFAKIEKKWQNAWAKNKIFSSKNNSKKRKFYCLEMFPYPSASFLHMGHVRDYTIGDAIARYKRMSGFNVLYPMGYDSFGLPAENAAKKESIHPRDYTNNAIKKIIEYQKALGNSYDWDRVITTHKPEYYKWNQFFFLKFLEKGLVYRKKAPVNWCSECNSVLANEEVVNGNCWRHENNSVIQKELEQWFLKITAYADELLNDIENLEWSERIKNLQRNWIGKSEGTLAKFRLKDSNDFLEIFTTRVDTIFSVTFLVMAPEHPKVLEFVKGTKYEKSALDFIKKMANAPKDDEKSKEGFFTGKYVINPATNKEIPVWLANFVLMDYGTGVVMADAHDQRDWDFARKYNIPLIEVLRPKDNSNIQKDKTFEDYGILYNSEQFDGLTSEEAMPQIRKWLEKNKLGKKIIQYKLRDWLISRQRYWGTPIPIVYCKSCAEKKINFKEYKSYLIGASKIKDKELKCIGVKILEITKEGNRKVLIPNEKISDYLGLIKDNLDEGFWNEVVGNDVRFIFKFKGGKIKDFVLSNDNKLEIAKLCSDFNNEPLEKTEDLFGYLLDNNFYQDYIQIIKNSEKEVIIPINERNLPVILPEKADFKSGGNPLNHDKNWINTKCPKCGGNAKRETDTMGGFVDSSWYFLRYCSPKDKKNAFDSNSVSYWMPVDQYIGGIEHAVGHLIYSRFFTKVLRDLKMLKIDEPFTKLFNQGILYKDGHKMSKSFGNIVTQTDISDKYGIDTARLFLMSVASPDSDMEWNDKGAEGSFRFLQKVSRISEMNFKKSNIIDEHKINLAIKNYSELIDNFKFNIAIIELMKYADYLEKNPVKKGYEALLKMLSIFAPHTCEELWHNLKNDSFISIEPWPKIDFKKINPEIELSEKIIENIRSDINYIINLLKIKNPKKITLIISQSWKYEMYGKVISLIEKKLNHSDIIKELMKSDLKKYGQEVVKLIPKIVEKRPNFVLSKSKELKLFKENIFLIKEEFGCDVIVEDGDRFKHDKSKFALPGKPALIIE